MLGHFLPSWRGSHIIAEILWGPPFSVAGLGEATLQGSYASPGEHETPTDHQKGQRGSHHPVSG